MDVSLGLKPQAESFCPFGAMAALTRRFAFGVRRSVLMLVLVLVLVLKRCCLQKRRVNPIRSAKPELHPASAGLEVLKGRLSTLNNLLILTNR